MFTQIGNLILLPVDLNKFASNKDWSVKYLYYCHVGQRNEGELEKLRADAKKKGIELKKRATDKLKTVKYNCAVEPIIGVNKTGTWDAKLIMSRTQQIKELTWETLFPWLES